VTGCERVCVSARARACVCVCVYVCVSALANFFNLRSFDKYSERYVQVVLKLREANTSIGQ
jgi:hypothetical protein